MFGRFVSRRKPLNYLFRKVSFANLSYANAMNVDKINFDEGAIKLQFNMRGEAFEIGCENDTTLNEIKEALIEKTEAKDIIFLNTNKVRISGNSTFEQLGYRDFYAIINGEAVIRFKNVFDNIEDFQDDKLIQNLSDIGAPYFYTNIVGSYLQRLEHVNEQVAGKRFLDERNGPAEISVDKLIGNMIEAIPDPKTNYNFNLEGLEYRLSQLKEEYSTLNSTKDYIMAKASRRAKLYMSLGLVAIGGQFAFVGYGTYYLWSWDVVEPLAYFSTLAATILLTTQYFKLKTDYEHTSYHEYLRGKIFTKIAPKYGFDIEHYDSVKAEINNIKGKLKMSILIDL